MRQLPQWLKNLFQNYKIGIVMIENIKPGMENRAEMTVTAEDTAKAYSSGALEVFATPGMIALMECASIYSNCYFYVSQKDRNTNGVSQCDNIAV